MELLTFECILYIQQAPVCASNNNTKYWAMINGSRQLKIQIIYMNEYKKISKYILIS